MIKPEPPVEIPRPLFSRRSDVQPAPLPARAEQEFQPRYVQLHALRAHGHGARNLAWGVVIVLLAFGLLGLALFLAGAEGLRALAACLVTCMALFVLARMHIFRQRNGGFLALGLVCLLGAVIPLVELGFVALGKSVKAPAASEPVTGQAIEAQPLALTTAFALAEPDPKSGPRVKVLKDSRVPIEGKPFLIKAGDIFPLGSKTDGEVTLVVRDLLVALPADATQILDDTASATPAAAPAVTKAPAPASQQPPGARPATTEEPPLTGNETPAQITSRAQREVIRRYPALGVKDSLENQMFVSMYREIRDAGGDDFFGNPEWPIELAELLAKREKWVPGAPPITVSGGPAAAAAAAEEAAAEDPAPPAAPSAPPTESAEPAEPLPESTPLQQQ